MNSMFNRILKLRILNMHLSSPVWMLTLQFAILQAHFTVSLQKGLRLCRPLQGARGAQQDSGRPQ